MDQIIADSVFFTQQLSESVSVEFKYVLDQNPDLLLENTRLMNEPLTGFPYLQEATKKAAPAKYPNTETVTDVKTQSSNVELSEKDLANMALNRLEEDDEVDEDAKKYLYMNNADIKKEIENDPGNKGLSDTELSNKVAEAVGKRDDLRKDINDAVKDLKSDIRSGKVPKVKYDNGRFYRTDSRVEKSERMSPKKDTPTRALDAPQLLKDSYIKKINGMLPYTIQASFRVKGKDGSTKDEVKFLIGVKSVLHPIQVKDLVEDIDDLINGKNKNLRKVKYKTGEIGFLDYVFNIKQIKADAAKQVVAGKRWINTLKRLAEYNKTNGSLLNKPISAITGGNVPIPNGTLILTSSDVSLILTQSGIDLNKVGNIKKLAKNLFLIGVVIVDSTAGSMKVLFPDSDSDWDVQSLAAIDSEVSKTDNSQLMKELNKKINS